MKTTVTVTVTELLPQVWDDERDGAFFRLVTPLFTPQFLFGAGVLLASYDDSAADGVGLFPTRGRGGAKPAAVAPVVTDSGHPAKGPTVDDVSPVPPAA
jgi:hypothetical protein